MIPRRRLCVTERRLRAWSAYMKRSADGLGWSSRHPLSGAQGYGARQGDLFCDWLALGATERAVRDLEPTQPDLYRALLAKLFQPGTDVERALAEGISLGAFESRWQRAKREIARELRRLELPVPVAQPSAGQALKESGRDRGVGQHVALGAAAARDGRAPVTLQDETPQQIGAEREDVVALPGHVVKAPAGRFQDHRRAPLLTLTGRSGRTVAGG